MFKIFQPIANKIRNSNWSKVRSNAIYIKTFIGLIIEMNQVKTETLNDH